MPLGKEVGLGPGHIVLDGDPALTAAPPYLWPMPIVAKRSPISATAELLLELSNISHWDSQIKRWHYMQDIEQFDFL